MHACTYARIRSTETLPFGLHVIYMIRIIKNSDSGGMTEYSYFNLTQNSGNIT